MYINNDILKNRESISLNEIYNKINFIDYIVWINLDRSQKRKSDMEELLKNININNTRISAIDGRIDNLTNYKNLAKSMSNYEIACTLSHIKAINYLSNINGNYFLVVEDDISLENLKYFSKDLKNIILNAPSFDILLINTTHDRSFINYNEYKNWSGECSTVAYIISRSGINKIVSIAQFNNNNFIINKSLSCADIFIYKYVNTYVYKYNFIASKNEDSEIHSDHLSWHKECSKIALNDILYNLDKI